MAIVMACTVYLGFEAAGLQEPFFIATTPRNMQKTRVHTSTSLQYKSITSGFFAAA